MQWTDEQFAALQVVQILRGSLGQIVWILFIAEGRAMTSEEIAMAGGLSVKTVNNACKQLHFNRLLEKQTIAHGKQVWGLGRQLAVLLPTMLGAARLMGEGENGGQTLVGQVVGDGDHAKITSATGGESDSRTEEVSVLGAMAEIQKGESFRSDGVQNGRSFRSGAKNDARTEEVSVLDCPSSLKTSSSSLTNLKKESTTSRAKTETAQITENLAACATVGIAEPAASQIAAMGHVTPAYIRGHVYADNVEIPQAIYRMKRAWRVPTRKKRTCPACFRMWTPAVDAPVPEVCPRCAERDAAPVTESPDSDDELTPPETAEVAPIEPNESIAEPIGDGHLSVMQAWETIKGQLSVEMPKASYETWVRDTLPISYADNSLKIATRNSYARDWLDSRLSSTVRRLLVGIANRSVDVQFVVAQGVGDG